MRRTEQDMKKVRLRIIELRKDGLDYEEIRRKTGASPNTISKILKNFNGRYCLECGATDPQVLEQHHPDKLARPNETICLCSNCHSVVTRQQMRDMREKKAEPVTATLVTTPVPLPLSVQLWQARANANTLLPATVQTNYVSHPLATANPDDLIKSCLFLGALGCICGALNPQMNKQQRLLAATGSALCLWQLRSQSADKK